MKKIILSVALSSTLMYAEGAFSVGHKHFSFHLSQDNDYTVIGGSVHYYAVDNLAIGASFSTWLGDKPSINRITVPVTYYIPMDYSIRPYLGVFAQYTFMGDDKNIKYDDYSSYGGRAGLIIDVSENMYSYAGWVQTKNNSNQVERSEGYPEFGFGMSF